MDQEIKGSCLCGNVTPWYVECGDMPHFSEYAG
jgi:hypothetical protein